RLGRRLGKSATDLRYCVLAELDASFEGVGIANPAPCESLSWSPSCQSRSGDGTTGAGRNLDVAAGNCSHKDSVSSMNAWSWLQRMEIGARRQLLVRRENLTHLGLSKRIL